MAAALAAAGALPAPASGQSLRTRAAAPDAVPGELIVRYAAGSSAAERTSARSRADVAVARDLRIPRAHVVRAKPGTPTAEARRTLARSRAVAFVEPNRVVRALRTPDDPLFAADFLWGLQNSPDATAIFGGVPDADIDAPEAWDRTTGSTSVVVGVVDEGVHHGHPDLAAHIWRNPGEVAGNGRDDDGNGYVDDVRGWDVYAADADPMDEGGHGTHVAGTIGAVGNNGVGITGVSWSATLMPVRALGPDGGSDATIAEALDYAGDNGAHVVNASLGREGGPSQLVEAAIADNPSTLYVFAAGNGGEDGVGDDADVVGSAPCASTQPNVVCVAATDAADALTGFSNYGDESVDLAAPGQDVLSAAISAVLFQETFEQPDLARWSNAGWTRGVDELGGYVSTTAANATLATASTLPLGARTDCRLEFVSAQAIVGPGELVVESSTDGTTWTVAATFGDSGRNWQARSVALARADQRLRFRLVSDGKDEAMLDDVAVLCRDLDDTSYVFSSGTSMAAPHVAGAAAVLKSLDADLSPVAIRRALLATGDAHPTLAGRTATGSRLNLARAVEHLRVPSATTGEAADVGARSARLTGVVDPRGIATSHVFEYGTSEALDRATAVQPAGSGIDPRPVSATLEGLEPGTTYHYRVVALRGNERHPGIVRTFTTAVEQAVVDSPAEPLPAEQPVDSVAEMRRTAEAACTRTRRRGRVACRLTAKGATRAVGVIRDRRGRRVGRFAGPTGRRLTFRVERLRRGRYSLRLTLRDAAGRKAVVTRRVRL